MLEAVRRKSDSENDQGICSFYLAYAAFKKGEKTAAMGYLRTAKEHYPNCLVAARIEKKIQEPSIE